MYDLLKDAAMIFCESTGLASYKEARMILEDAESPIANKHVENLYRQIVSKNHIDFDDIPKSRGNIVDYKGYQPMMETLNTMRSIADESGAREAVGYVDSILQAVKNITNFSDLYQRGYTENNSYVIMEYQLFVYCCVEATTSVLSEFVNFIKGFDSNELKIRFRNTRYRANRLYIDQVEKFNSIVAGSSYRGYLQSVLDKGRENFVGATAVGIGAVAFATLVGIVPVTRSLAYQFYRLRTKLSDALALQAYFLELNKSCVEANRTFDKAQKEKILKKQDAIRVIFLRLADKIKVDNARAERDSTADRKKDNAPLSIGNTKDQVDNAPYDGLL